MTAATRRTLATVLALAMTTTVAACGGDKGSDKPSGSPAAGTDSEPRKGGTLTVLSAGDVDYIDPGASYQQFGWSILHDLHRNLYSHKPGDPEKPVPDLAAAPPRISAGGRTITVKLRRGVRFSPPVSREVTSADVKYAIERAFTKNLANGYSGLYFKTITGVEAFTSGKAKEIAGIETPDASTLVFRTTRGGPLAAALAMPITAPVPKEYARKFDAKSPSTYGRHQVATGPYMIEGSPSGTATGYRPGRSLRLVRNPNWDARTDFRPAHLDRIVVQQGNEDATVAARRIILGRGMVSGDFHPDPATLQRFYRQRKDQFPLYEGTGNRYAYMNTSLPPFDDIDVRKAVIAGTDREALRLARGGPLAGDIATHILYPGTPGFEEAGGKAGPDLDYLRNPRGDQRIAAKYFKAAGFASGRYEGDAEVFMIDARGGVGQKTAEVMQAQLERMGFEVELRLVSPNTAYTKYVNVPKAKVSMSVSVGWIRDFADAESILTPTFHGDRILEVNNANWPQLDVEEINDAMDAASRLSDPAQRAEAWGEVDRMIMAQAPVVPYLWDQAIRMHSPDVEYVGQSWNGGSPELSSISLR